VSVIYATLERLEAANPIPAAQQSRGVSLESQRFSPHPDVEPGGLSVKVLATVMMVVIGGASLMLWRGVGAPAVAQQLLQLNAAGQAPAAPTSAGQLKPVPVPAQDDAALESVEPTSATTTAGNTVAAVPATAVVAKVAPEPHTAAATESPEREPVAVAAVVSRAEPDTDHSPAIESAAAPERPGDQRQVPASDAVQRAEVEEAVDEARLALSRGRYPQALAALESLASVPQDRADFWLIKGSAHLGMGQLDLAGMAFASARSLAPDNAQIAVQQAILLQEQGDHAGALVILKGAASRHPEVPEIYLNRGYSEQALGAVREAERSFRTFMKMTESRSLYLRQRELIGAWLAQFSATQ
jgi:Flp pilus assembly protein TadD